MKVLAISNPSGYYDTESRELVIPEDVIEMTVKDGVASSVSTPLLIGYRSSDVPGLIVLIVEDRLPPSPEMVSAKYEATMKLKLEPKQGEILCPNDIGWRECRKIQR